MMERSSVRRWERGYVVARTRAVQMQWYVCAMAMVVVSDKGEWCWRVP